MPEKIGKLSKAYKSSQFGTFRPILQGSPTRPGQWLSVASLATNLSLYLQAKLEEQEDVKKKTSPSNNEQNPPSDGKDDSTLKIELGDRIETKKFSWAEKREAQRLIRDLAGVHWPNYLLEDLANLLGYEITIKPIQPSREEQPWLFPQPVPPVGGPDIDPDFIPDIIPEQPPTIPGPIFPRPVPLSAPMEASALFSDFEKEAIESDSVELLKDQIEGSLVEPSERFINVEKLLNSKVIDLSGAASLAAASPAVLDKDGTDEIEADPEPAMAPTLELSKEDKAEMMGALKLIEFYRKADISKLPIDLFGLDKRAETIQYWEIAHSFIEKLINAKSNEAAILRAAKVFKEAADGLRAIESIASSSLYSVFDITVVKLILLYRIKAENTGIVGLFDAIVEALNGEEFVSAGVYETTSPLGILNTYRQFYTHSSTYYGPPEEVISLRPGETLESSREIETSTVESVSEEFEITTRTSTDRSSTEREELSEEVTESNSSSIGTAVSVGGGGNFGVWNASGSASMTTKDASKNASKKAMRKSQEVTIKVSEQRTTRVKRQSKRTEQSRNFASEQRQLTAGDGLDDTINPNYTLRGLFNEYKVDLYEGKPRIVWSLYLSNPAEFMAPSKYLYFEDDIELMTLANTSVYPEKPKSGTVRKTVDATLNSANKVVINIILQPGQKAVSASIVSIKDLEQRGQKGGKSRSKRPDRAPTQKAIGNIQPKNTRQVDGKTVPIDDGHFFVEADVDRGDTPNIRVTLDIAYVPSDQALSEYDKMVEGINKKLEYDAGQQAFNNMLEHLSHKSRIKPRPSAELRMEERYAVLNRLVTHIYGSSGLSSVPPGEIELINRYFDIESLFMYFFSPWWKPQREKLSPYSISNETAHARLGSSLGWNLQLDGDNKRNFFLNCPWVQICVPIREGYSTQALEWLAENVEGNVGVVKRAGSDSFENRNDAREELVDRVVDEVKEEVENFNWDKNEAKPLLDSNKLKTSLADGLEDAFASEVRINSEWYKNLKPMHDYTILEQVPGSIYMADEYD